GDPRVRAIFMKHHADLLEADFWQQHKERIKAGYVHDVFPYDRGRRFVHKLHLAAAATLEASSETTPVEESVDVPSEGPLVHDQGRLTGFTAGGSSSAD